MTLQLPQAIEEFQPELPLAVAFSGGADSTALLYACVRRWPGQVRAVHIHHGLQEAADSFEAHCQALCTKWGVPLVVARVNAKNAPRQSPEDAARLARYEALTHSVLTHPLLMGVKGVALAQHADDQVETLLLALSRGAGLPGLSGMPMEWSKSGLRWYRPLMRVSAQEVRAWLAAQAVSWIEDPSNQEARYTRNRIRAQVLPALDAAFTGWRDTFARSARHCSSAQEALQELAVIDAEQTGIPPRIKALQALSRSRRINLLRYWLLGQHRTRPSTAQLEALELQVLACTTRAHQLNLKVGAGVVQRQGEVLHWIAAT